MTEGKWFRTQIRRPHAPLQLFCLPHAGGGAAAYAAWDDAIGVDIEINSLMLPGREQRIQEVPSIDPARVAAAVAHRADRPYALFGHSMGALLAFHVAHELRRSGAEQPVHMFLSGCAPPDEAGAARRYERLSKLDDEALMRAVAQMGGIPHEILTDAELLALLTPALRADFAWLHTASYPAGPPLEITVTALAGDLDDAAFPNLVDGWRRHTSARFKLEIFEGAHFFPHEQLAGVGDLIRGDLGLIAVP